MIGKAKWFNRRKYSGWGLMPRTWEGWLYIIVGVSLIGIIQMLPLVPYVKFFLFSVVGLVFILDLVHILASIKMDERETKIEAMAERNASWAMVGTLGILTLYIAEAKPALTNLETIQLLMIPLITGVIVKAISNFILDRMDI
jgi:hypothetical protein